MTWDPQRYLTYADERARPFLDLVSRVDADAPRRVVDLGCGTGHLTALLARRWPSARVEGLDSSAEMVAAADPSNGVAYRVGDVRDWAPGEPVDVVVSNAVLQWVPDHLSLLPRLAAGVAPGGWLALQVPGNFGEPSHVLRAELAGDPRFAEHLDGVAVPNAHPAEVYLHRLLDLGFEVQAWETTYLHVLQGPDPVFDWVAGTAAGPTLQALPEGLRAEFADELKAALRAAYPAGGHGTVLPFRRVFAVGRLRDRA